MTIRAFLLLSLLLAAGPLWPRSAATEPLRILVSEFSGPRPFAKYVMTTLYFEVAKGFAAPANTEKGGWVLYGQEPLGKQSHDSALAAANWPSVKADMVLWGSVSRYGDGYLVQANLSITPQTLERTVRPERWSVSFAVPRREPVTMAVELPRTSYEFEPFEVPGGAVGRYTSPEGIPLYSKREGGNIVDYARGAFHFTRIEPDAIQLQPRDGKAGWARLPYLGPSHSQAIAFVRAMVRFMRGDWGGALESFEALQERQDMPRALRIDSAIYAGIALEKQGKSGQAKFDEAYALNPVDRIAAQYAIMGRLAMVERAQHAGDDEAGKKALEGAVHLIKKVDVLFPHNDPWIGELRRAAEGR